MPLSGLETPSDYEKQTSPLPSDAKNASRHPEVNATDDIDDSVLRSERDIATHIVSVHDDPTLNPWTIRAFVIGLGLSAFGSALGKSKSALSLQLIDPETFEQRRYTTSNQYGLDIFLAANLS